MSDIVLPGQNIPTIPMIMRTMTATNKTPPITVKSHFVWNAKSVSEKQTTAVIPTASITSSAWNAIVVQPSMNPWARVKMPRKMKFVGAVRRTLSQHAMQINVTKRTAMDT